MSINTSIIGEILILLLLFSVTIRVFFTRLPHTDTILVNVYLALILSVVQIIAWGANFSELVILVLCLLTLIINYRAINRLHGKLFIDSYSSAFIISSLIMIVVLVVTMVILIINRPVYVNPSKNGVIETRERLSGDFTNGFDDVELRRKSCNCVLYKFEPKEAGSKSSIENTQQITQSTNSSELSVTDSKRAKPIILFVPDERGQTLRYQPYLSYLAKSGYTVYSADFYTGTMPEFSMSHDVKYIRRGLMLLDFVGNPEYEKIRRDSYAKYYADEYKALLALVEKRNINNNAPYFLIGDGMSTAGIFESNLLSATNVSSKKILGYFSLSFVSEYKTSGYGFIEQTDPFLAHFWFKLKREPLCFIPKYVVLETEKRIEASYDTK